MLEEKYNDVSNPVHYAGDGEVQCKRALESMMTPAPSWMSHIASYWWGCAFKYLWRWPNKNKIKDLLKARQCIDYLIIQATEDVKDHPIMDIKDGEDDQ